MSPLDSVANAAARIQQIQSNLASVLGTPATSGSDFDSALSDAQATSDTDASFGQALTASALGGAGTATTASVLGLAGASPATTVDASTAPSGQTLPAGVTGQDVVSDAQQYLGIPYVFGGESESGMDCSGLVQKVMGDLGMSTPRTVPGQAQLGTAVPSLAQAQPGDLIVEKGNGHIQIYAGDGKVIEAPKPGENVVERPEWLSSDQIGTIRRVTTSQKQTTAASGTGTGSIDPAMLAQMLTMNTLSQSLSAAASSDGTMDDSSDDPSSDALSSLADALEGTGGTSSSTGLSSLAGLTGSDAADGPSASDAADATSALLAALSGTGTSSAAGDQTAALMAALAGNGSTAGAAASAASGSAPTPPTQAQLAALPAQIAAPVAQLVSQGVGDHTVVVKVVPEQLGPVTVTAHVTAQGVKIELQSPSQNGTDALNSVLSDLRRDLAGTGIQASLNVTTDPNGQGQQNGQSAQQALFALLEQGAAGGGLGTGGGSTLQDGSNGSSAYADSPESTEELSDALSALTGAGDGTATSTQALGQLSASALDILA